VSTGCAIVLGGRGFIGRHVCRTFAQSGFRVNALGHGEWSADEQAAWGVSHWTPADIDIESLKSIPDHQSADIIVHCGGSATVSGSYESPLDDYRRTVASTATLLEFVRTVAANRPRVVVASSAAVYGDQGEVDLTESATRSPVSPYGFHKLIAENLCDSYSRFFGVRISIVRLFSVYGEGLRKQLLWDASRKLTQGSNRFYGTGHELRDWLHVDDAARLLCAAAQVRDQDNFEIYNGGHSHQTTNGVLTELAALLGSTMTPVFTGEIHIGNPRRLTANSNHAHRQLSWTPQIGLSDGLLRYAGWYRGAQGVSV
jgi:UDP-glucose 4-epimerase